MQWNVVDMSGQKVEQAELPAEIFEVTMNESLLHSVIKAYRANRRQGTHATKTRSLVSGTGKKPFNQKGTGNARQGSTRGPHQYHGAVAHGPQPRDYRQHINKKVKQQALKIALSDKVRHNKLVIVDKITIEKYSTKFMREFLQKLLPSLKVLLVDERKDDLLYKSVRNMHGANCLAGHLVNAENILASEHLLLTSDSLSHLCQRLKGGAK